MQNIHKKILNLFFVLLFVLLQTSYAQEVSSQLAQADTLFKHKKYTEAAALYEKILVTQREFTPKMLLKMAFIKEAGNDIPAALYYLNLYYSRWPESAILQQIDGLAAKNKLQGYEVSDFDYVLLTCKRHSGLLTTVVLLLLGGLWAYLYWRKNTGREVFYPSLLLVFLLLVFFYIYNFGTDLKKGIVRTEQALLMEDASAGAKQADVIAKGNCLNIVDKKDIWYEVKWNEQKLYIRENNLYIID